MSAGSILGHDGATATLSAALTAGRLHHAWLIAGPRGIGKASLAWRFARSLLSAPSGTNDDPLPFDRQTHILMENGAHPDFAVLERLEKPSKSGGDAKLARGIVVDQVRGLARLLNSASSMGGRRVVLVDSADDLETSAANALLKSLEEPPEGVVFLLVAHAPGRLLPTIRSRCRLLRLAPLDDANMALALGRIAPELTAQEQAALLREAAGSPGRASDMLGLDIAGLEASLAVVRAGGEAARRESAKLSVALAPASARERLAAFVDLVPRVIAAQVRASDHRALGSAMGRWEEAQRLADGAIIPYQLEPAALVLGLCAQAMPAADVGDSGRSAR